jgi:predicted nucleic acid-binding protein
MDLMYLNYNCFQRGFDDPRQIRIRMEALACQEIFLRAERNEIQLVWSFMHEDENILCPFSERKLEVLRLATLCKIKVGPKEVLYDLAKSFQEKGRFSAKDAIHLACARYAKARLFITCDNKLIKKVRSSKIEVTTLNPVDYIRQEAMK